MLNISNLLQLMPELNHVALQVTGLLIFNFLSCILRETPDAVIMIA